MIKYFDGNENVFIFAKWTGLVQGYAAEKQSADACIQSLEETNEMLAKDLEKTRLKLKEMVEKEAELILREQDLAHQRHSLELSVGDQERGQYSLTYSDAFHSSVMQTMECSSMAFKFAHKNCFRVKSYGSISM